MIMCYIVDYYVISALHDLNIGLVQPTTFINSLLRFMGRVQGF